MKIYIIGKAKVLSQQEIVALEDSLPVQLPADYKAFLAAFGHGEINGRFRIVTPSREHFTENYPAYAERWHWHGEDQQKAVDGVTIVTTHDGSEIALAVDDDECPIMLLDTQSPIPLSFPSFEALLDHYSAEYGFQENVYFDPYNNNVKVKYISLHQDQRGDCALMKQWQQKFVDAWKFDRKFDGDTHPRYVLQLMGGWVQFDLLTCSTITVRYQLHGAQKAAEVINFLSGSAQAANGYDIVQKKVLLRHERVHSFQAKEGNTIVLFQDNRLQLNGYTIAHDLPDHDPDLYKDVLFYEKAESVSCVHHVATGKTDIVDGRYLRETYADGVAVFKQGSEYCSIDIASQHVLTRFSLRPGADRTFFKDYIVQASFEGQERAKILCFHRHSNTHLWEYDVTEEGRYRNMKSRHSPIVAGKVERVIGLHDDCLVVAITGERLLSLNIHTGHKRWRIDSVPGAIPPYLEEEPGLPRARDFRMDAHGHLSSFYQGIYIEIDVLTGTALKTINDYERLKALGIALNHHQWYKEGAMIYYFRDGSKGALPQVVAYDIDRRSPAWTHVFQDDNRHDALMQYRLKSMTYDDGKFFVLDWNDVLTVLEN